MKKLFLVAALSVMGVAGIGDADARGGGGGGGAHYSGGGGYRHSGGGGYHYTGGGYRHSGGWGHYHSGVGVGIAVGSLWSPWYYPAPYYYPSPYYEPYYYPPVVVERSEPPVYVEQSPPAPATGYWYYCQSSGGYYPNVKECPAGWVKVLPHP